jgi:hypothetical protein
MCATLDDTTMIQNENHVRIPNRREPMRDYKTGAALEQSHKSLLQAKLS